MIVSEYLRELPVALGPDRRVTFVQKAGRSLTEIQTQPLTFAALGLWAFRSLGLRAEVDTEGVCHVRVPDSLRAKFGGQAKFDCVFGGQPGDSAGDGPLWFTPASPLGEQVFELVRNGRATLHATPTTQPVSVHELAAALFSCYSVVDGHVRLAGCRLDNRPVLRRTHIHRDAAGTMYHEYFASDGSCLDEQAVASLGLEHVDPLRGTRSRDERQRAQLLLAAVPPAVREDEIAQIDTLIWCKYATGKLHFAIGKHSSELDFEGWTGALVRGEASPPPFRCPHTGCESYEIVAADDGELTVAAALDQCEESGMRVASSQLETCAATGKRVYGEILATCPLTGERVVPSSLRSCKMCGQLVSRSAIKAGRCAACRRLKRIRKDDPRMALVLNEHPRLDQWRNWKLSETADAYVLLAHAALRQTLFVIDKETLRIRYCAISNRWWTRWTMIPDDQHEQVLR